MSRPMPAWSRRAREAAAAQAAAQPTATVAAVQQPVAIDPNTPRGIYLACQCFEGNRAHWMLWIPSLQYRNIGKVIQVTGNVWGAAFSFQIKDNHDFSRSHHHIHFVHLGNVNPAHVVDVIPPNPATGSSIRPANDLRDAIERVAAAQPLPFKNTTIAMPAVNDPIWLKGNPQFERCQEWTRRVVSQLVARHFLAPEALAAMDTAGISVGIPGRDGRSYATVNAA